MIKRDLLQRAIDEMGKTLSKIITDLLDLKTTEQIGKVMTTASQDLNGQLTIDFVKLLELADEDFLNKLKLNNSFNHANIEKLGDILFLMAEKSSAYNKVNLYTKCLTLYEFLEQAEKVYSFERRARIAKIKAGLKNFPG